MKKIIYSALAFALVAVLALSMPSCGDDAQNHVCGEWTVIKEPTCSEKGIRVRTCTICGAEETDEINIVSHKYDGEHCCVWCKKQEETENIRYSLSEDGSCYVVKGYNGNKKEIFIPSERNGLPVKEIANEAFYGNTKITSVYVHPSVTKIGEKAFGGCVSLVSVCIPNSIEEIGADAFEGCVKLKEIINRSSLDIVRGSDLHGGIAKNAVFVHSESESKIKRTEEGYLYFVDDAVNLIGYVGEKTSIVLPDKIENKKYIVCDNAFAYSGITELEITDGVLQIGDQAFTYCSQLEKLLISSPSTVYGSRVFSNCIFLKEVTFNDRVESLGDSMFRNCTSIEEITLPEGLVSIGKDTFYACSALVSVTVNSSAEEIGEYAFFGCSSLKDITFGDGVKKIGMYAFSGCTSLEGATLSSGVTEISDFAFFGCTSLKKIDLSSELERIGNYALKDCISLAELVYPKTMLKWGGITKGSEWNTNTGSFVVTCSDGKG